MLRLLRLQLFLGTFSLLLLFLGAALPAHAQNRAPTQNSAIAASELINADGTLNLQKSIHSALDLAGWNVALDPQRGPVFAPNAPTADGWSAFGNGSQCCIYALAVNGTDVYIGGTFTQICGNALCNSGNISVNHIAKWNGTSWSALGNGVNSDVYTIAVSGSDVYVGGSFTYVCGNLTCDSGNATVNRIAKWNGSTWSALGHGVAGGGPSVDAIVVNGSDVYVGGSFTQTCGNDDCSSYIAANRITKWNGSAWSTLGNGLDYPIHALAMNGGDLYAGGEFTHLCGNEACNTGNVSANRLAKWNGASWAALGNGVNHWVLALAVSGSNVYAGGLFTQLCGNAACDTGNVTVNYIANWNGSGLSAVSNGIGGPVNALGASGSDLYAGGNFTQVCGNAACNSGNVTVNEIAKWNGSSWSALANGLNSVVNEIVVSGSDVYAAGAFATACGNLVCDTGNVTVNNVAKYGALAGCVTKPAKPTLTKPANNAVTSKTRVKLKWNAANCADTYTVFVKDAATGQVVDKQEGLTALRYKTDALTRGKTYKWYVKAVNTMGSTKSRKRTFQVQ